MDKLFAAYEALKARIDFRPQVAVVLGSGLGGFAARAENAVAVPYGEVPGMPRSTVEGHAGQFVFGEIAGKRVLLLQGRVHLYEGYSPAEAVMPVRLAGLLGAETLVLTNAAGGITYPETGTLMLLSDHIAASVPSPLIGKNDERLGKRFPDMSDAYDPALRALAKKCARTCGVDLKEGVYMQFSGPQFESPAEVRMARILGADAVGMSTAVECIAARHMGMRVMGLSCITNPASGIGGGKLDHVDVQYAADLAGEALEKLLVACIGGM